jgi:hypothetical protein
VRLDRSFTDGRRMDRPELPRITGRRVLANHRGFDVALTELLLLSPFFINAF